MSATDILKLCDEVLAASKAADTKLPWKVDALRWPCRYTDAEYIAIAANTAPAMAEYIRRLHSAAAARGIDIDTWDLPRQPR